MSKTTRCYLLTEDNTTRKFEWGDNFSRITTMSWGTGISHEGGIVAFDSPLVAAMYADNNTNELWECIGEYGKKLGGGRYEYTRLTAVCAVVLPEVTEEQRIAFGILCAEEVCSIPEWRTWAENWLSGAERSQETATAVANATNNVAARLAAHAAGWGEGRFAANSAREAVVEATVSDDLIAVLARQAVEIA